VPFLPPVLGNDDLPLAERMAARLDGELFALGDAYCPIDVIESPALRLAAILAGRSTRLIAELGTAAWVWNAVDLAPPRLELCVNLRARARPQATPHATVREVVLADTDTVAWGDYRVTSTLRTAVDLARSREPFTMTDRDAVRALARIGRFEVADCLAHMNARRNLPDKRRAAERLRSCL
jgi:hypothetical protein